MSKSSSFQTAKNRVQGIDKVHWIIIIPTGVPDIKDAVNKAIESTPGCIALLDGALYYKFWWIPYIYGEEYFLIEGTPLIDPSLAGNEINIDEYSAFILDKKGDIVKKEEITEKEFESKKKEFDNKIAFEKID
ncbi:MAG: hypothetical protein HZC11_04680 [Nitrospirae bacterium]|nr:hypothetical protein [Nitrospirota bacterium]